MRKALVICILSFHAFNASFSQNLTVLDSLKVRDFIDTLFIDRDINYWSIRLFTHLKSNWFGIMNSDQKLSYVPNNLFGIGVGLGTRKLLLDIGFSPGGNQENVTHRIDLQTAFILKKHFLEAYLHRYQGYNVRSDLDMPEVFRKDLRTLSTGVNYFYLFNADNYSIAADNSGHSRQKKMAGSFAIGGFLFFRNLRADSSIVGGILRNDFNEEAQIERMVGISGGFQGGFTIIFPLPYYFFTSLSIYPGVGLKYENITSETSSYVVENPIFLKMETAGSTGYNGNRIYVTFRLSFNIGTNELGYGNQSISGAWRAKLAVGYKLQKRN